MIGDELCISCSLVPVESAQAKFTHGQHPRNPMATSREISCIVVRDCGRLTFCLMSSRFTLWSTLRISPITFRPIHFRSYTSYC